VYKATKADIPNSALALFGLAIYSEFLSAFQHFSDMVFLLLLIGPVDESIVKVTHGEVVNIGP
jgi:hypothetical protein